MLDRAAEWVYGGTKVLRVYCLPDRRRILVKTSRSPLLADPRNLDLLRRLQADPRVPVAELSRTVGMSAPAVRERLQRLEEAGVIAGWRLELDPETLGLPIGAFVRVRPLPGQLPRVIELAREMPQVLECHRVTGEDCLVIRVQIPSIAALAPVLDRFLAFGQTTTAIIQSTPVPARAAPVEPVLG
jgi:Lrp/AsnC family leucine-responsive transcriptional regulator